MGRPPLGRPISRPDRINTYLRLDADVRAELEERAQAEGRSMSDVVNDALRAWLGDMPPADNPGKEA